MGHRRDPRRRRQLGRLVPDRPEAGQERRRGVQVRRVGDPAGAADRASSRRSATCRRSPRCTRTRRCSTSRTTFFSNAPVGQIFTKTAEDLKPQYLGKKNGPTRVAVENVLNSRPGRQRSSQPSGLGQGGQGSREGRRGLIAASLTTHRRWRRAAARARRHRRPLPSASPQEGSMSTTSGAPPVPAPPDAAMPAMPAGTSRPDGRLCRLYHFDKKYTPYLLIVAVLPPLRDLRAVPDHLQRRRRAAHLAARRPGRRTAGRLRPTSPSCSPTRTSGTRWSTRSASSCSPPCRSCCSR